MISILKRTHFFRFVILFIVFLLFSEIVSVEAATSTPYNNYYYDRWDNAVASPASYIPVKTVTVNDMGIEKLGVVNDLASDDCGKFYVLDSDNSIIYKFDNHLNLINKIIIKDGKNNVEFAGAQGLTVARLNGSLRFYIADTANKQIIICGEDGKFIKKVGRPKTDILPKDQVFSPMKIAVNENGIMYVLCQTMFDGAIMMNDDGEFLGLYGSNKVEVDANLLNDYFWKNLLGEKLRDKFSRYVPREYTNMALDDQGFMYTTTLITTDSAVQIRRLNWKSSDIIKGEFFGDSDNAYGTNKFIDIVAMGDGVFATLDSSRGRVFLYGNDGENILIFGGLGDKNGTFKIPIAIEAIEDDIYVYDQADKSITKFVPTQYGEKLLKANRMFLDGEYKESNDLWKEILRENNGCEKAYISIGRELMEKQEYDEALEYFKKSNAKTDYSDAYKQIRSVHLRKFFPFYATIFVAILIFIMYLLRNKGSYKSNNDSHPNTFLKKLTYTLFHPDKGCDILIKNCKAMNIAMPVIVILTLVVSVMQYQFTGYIFNDNEQGKMDIVKMGTIIFGLFFILVVSNWLVTTMTDGKGKLIEIANVLAFCLIPTLTAQVVNIAISNFIVAEEAMFIEMISLIGYGWTALLLFIQIGKIHEFKIGKNILMCLLTVVAVMIILVLLLLCFSIEQQIEIFITSIISELKMIS